MQFYWRLKIKIKLGVFIHEGWNYTNEKSKAHTFVVEWKTLNIEHLKKKKQRILLLYTITKALL